MLFYDQVNAAIPDDIERKTAYIIGGGIGGLAAAAFLATDAICQRATSRSTRTYRSWAGDGRDRRCVDRVRLPRRAGARGAHGVPLVPL